MKQSEWIFKGSPTEFASRAQVISTEFSPHEHGLFWNPEDWSGVHRDHELLYFPGPRKSRPMYIEAERISPDGAPFESRITVHAEESFWHEQGFARWHKVEAFWRGRRRLVRAENGTENDSRVDKDVASDLGKQKSKAGPRPRTEKRMLEVIRRYNNMDRDEYGTTEQFLENEFGFDADGTLEVAKSTFYGWMDRLKDKI